MRFVARVLSLILLVFAVLAGLVDAIQSVAAGELVLTPLIATWTANSPDTLAFLLDLQARYLQAAVWDTIVQWIMAQPACAVFLLFSLLFYLAGYRRTRPAGRFAA
ncbi:hypothetical protein [Hoeflea sp. AS16]|uniref:hypothetical protein n=1 Tax=unclassified Hoeflea TaxID=2614931 RepID=UPI00317AAD63